MNQTAQLEYKDRQHNCRTVEIEIDRERRYAPSTVSVHRQLQGGGTLRAELVDVRSYVVHPAGDIPPGCPLMMATDIETGKKWTILECLTDYGSRFYLFEGAAINSELRMVVWGFNARDYVLSRLPKCEVFP